MTSTFAASTVPEETAGDEATPLSGGVTCDTSPEALFSNWPAPVARPVFSGRELGAVLVLSALLHAGLATAAYNTDDSPEPKRLSRVEIDLARPPERPKPPTPAAVPPPPPKVIKQEKPQAVAPTPEPVPAEIPEPPSDTGSSAPAEEGGELYAGNGGLGVAPPAPPAPPAPVPPPAPAPVLQAREGANYLKNPRPAYPRRAKREGLEGTTLLRVAVQASGKPGAVKVQKSSGHEVLDEAAVEAVSKWTFVPATQGGDPVAGSVTVPIVFRLQ